MSAAEQNYKGRTAYRINEVTEMLGISRSTIYAMMNDGRLGYTVFCGIRAVQQGKNVGYMERLLMGVLLEEGLSPDVFTRLGKVSEHIKGHVHRIDSGAGASAGYLRSYSDIRREWVRHLAIVWREFLGDLPTVHLFEDASESRRNETDVDDVPEDDERVLYEGTERFIKFADACCYPAFGKKKVADEEFARHILNPSDPNQTESRVRNALRGFKPRPKDAGPPW